MVWVGPPLSARGPSRGSVLIRSVGARAAGRRVGEQLCPNEANAPVTLPSALAKRLAMVVTPEGPDDAAGSCRPHPRSRRSWSR